jgi:hypothetical protein
MNNDNFNAYWSFIFNDNIESLDLREIILSERKFTWASRREVPIYEKGVWQELLTNKYIRWQNSLVSPNKTW